MLTPYGKTLILSLLEPSLKEGSIEVTDGSNESRSSINKIEVTTSGIVVTSEFGLEQANFEWKTRRVLDKNGKVVDEADEDGGRKAAGSVWVMAVNLAWGEQ